MVIVTIVPILVGTCDLESLVASGHKKIWVSVTSKMLLPSATTNCGGLRPQKSKVITVGYPKMVSLGIGCPEMQSKVWSTISGYFSIMSNRLVYSGS